MVEIILTILCLLLTVFFVVVVATKYNSSVETNPKRPSKEETMFKTAERGIDIFESYGGSNDIERSSEEVGSKIIYKRKTKQLNKSDDKGKKSPDKGNNSDDKRNEANDKRNESDDKGKESNDQKNLSDEKRNESDDKGQESNGKRNLGDDKGQESNEGDPYELLSRDDIENEDSIKKEYNKFIPFVNEEKLKAEMAKAGTTLGLFQYIRKSLDHWKKQEVNVAVTGNAGTGKSSLINALRNLKPTDQGAAKVGVVETTTEVQKYTYPNNEHVALWDLPGTGTQSFAKDKYLDTMNFSKFDVVIIVTATRFLENDIWLAKEILKLGKNVLFVRTKIDIDMMNSKTDYPDDFCDTNIIDKIKANIADNLIKGGLPNLASIIYLVSSPDRSYDFQKLNATLKNLLNIKGKSICLLLQKYVKRAIQRKKDSIKNSSKIWRLIKTVRVFPKDLKTGLDFIASRDYNYCLKRFCLDDQSLEKCAKEMSISIEDLKKDLKDYTNDYGSCDNPPAFENKNFLIKFVARIPALYMCSNNSLEWFCDFMEKGEFRLVFLRLNDLEKELNPMTT